MSLEKSPPLNKERGAWAFGSMTLGLAMQTKKLLNIE
jgi:hypothetical protein